MTNDTTRPTITTIATQQDAPASGVATLPASLDERGLAELGLKSNDLPQIREIADRINAKDPMTVSEFGRDVAEHASRYADELLAEVRNRDLDEAGKKLSQVVNIARSLNMNALSDRRSKLPLVGPLIDKLKLSTGNFMGQFETTKEQIERLVAEVDQTQTGLRSRNGSLEQMFAAVKDEHRLLGLHIAAGKVRLDELRAHADSLRPSAQLPTEVQDLADLDAVITNLDIRIGNLQALQQSALQTLPQIRVVQTGNQVLIDKFHTVRQISIPAWKRQFMLALGLNEQRNAVQLADNIDNATNDLLRRNAELLHRNSVEAAKANQRLVIDIDTLQHVQNTLIKTVEDVIKISQDGVQQRKKAELEIEGMRKNLQLRLTRSGAGQKEVV